MFFCSVRTRGNFSPARNVLSTTEPLVSPFNFVRTNAPPLPGLTCWNSTIRHVWPSNSMCIQLRNWLVETTSATAPEASERRLPDLDQVLRERGQHLDAVLPHDGEILDPAAADALEVDPGLDRDDLPGLQRVRRLGREPRRLVDLEPDAVPEAVAEVAAVPGRLDRLAREGVRVDAGQSRLQPGDGALLRGYAHLVGAPQRVRQPAGRDRARAVAAVTVDAHAPVDRDERRAVDDPVVGAVVRERAVRARRDDRVEGHVVGTVGVQQLAQAPRDLTLGVSDEGLGRQRLEAAVGDARGL